MVLVPGGGSQVVLLKIIEQFRVSLQFLLERAFGSVALPGMASELAPWAVQGVVSQLDAPIYTSCSGILCPYAGISR